MDEKEQMRLAFRAGYRMKLAEANLTPEQLEKQAFLGSLVDLAKLGFWALFLPPVLAGSAAGLAASRFTEPNDTDVALLEDKVRLSNIENQLADVRQRIQLRKRLLERERERKAKPKVVEMNPVEDVAESWSFK